MIQETIDMLGQQGRDRVTGFEGVITSASFDLYGCVQMALSPRAKADAEEIKHGHWFDVARIEVLTGKKHPRVMPVPDFKAMARKPEEFGHGAAPKPPLGEGPA